MLRESGLNVLVAGTRSFGAAVVRELTTTTAAFANVRVVGVVAPPGDRTANEAAKRRLPCATNVTPELVRGLNTDVIVAAHSHAFIGARSRAAARLGAIGYHPSLLPRHRGRDAVRWTIKMGDPIAGGSVYWLTDNVDGGPIAAQDWCHVGPDWDHHQLWAEHLFPIGVRLIERVVLDLALGEMIMVPQDEQFATWEPSWEREPVWRPELPEIGPAPDGMRVVVGEDRANRDINGRAAI